MERTYVRFTLFMTFIISLPAVRSATCALADSIESEGACFHYNSTKLTYQGAKANLWISANDIAKEGTWVWEDDGTVATELSALWKSGEPSNRTDEDCAAIRMLSPDDKWLFDWRCTLEIDFLCMEKGLITTPDPMASTAPPTTTAATTTTEQMTTEKTSTEQTTTEQTISEQITAEQTTTEQMTTEKTSSEQTTIEKTTTDQTTTDQTTTTEQTTAEQITTEQTTNAILTSISTAKVWTTTSKESGADFIEVNVLLLLNVLAFKYLLL